MRAALLALVVFVVAGCQGYRYGAPMEACGHMFPTGHGYDAQSTPPPFKLTVSQNSYSPKDLITITLTSEVNPDNADEWFTEGILVQMRTYECERVTAIGSFQVQDCDNFLQPIDCFGLKNSSVRHYTHLHVYNATFTWKAPDQPTGHLYLRATIARNQRIFWTNLFSETIRDVSDNSAAPTEYCPVLSKQDGTSDTSGMSANILTMLGIALVTFLF